MTVLENVVFDEHSREVDYSAKSVTGKLSIIYVQVHMMYVHYQLLEVHKEWEKVDLVKPKNSLFGYGQYFHHHFLYLLMCLHMIS